MYPTRKIRKLKPIRRKSKHHAQIEQEIGRVFDRELFKPLFDILNTRENDKETPLFQAIASGRLYYADGMLFGAINAKLGLAIRNAGGVYDTRQRCYRIDLKKLDEQTRSMIARASQKNKAKHERIAQALKDLEAKAKTASGDFKKHIEQIIADLNGQAEKVLPSSLMVDWQTTNDQEATIANDYGRNLDLYIRGWMDDEILKLRKKVEENAVAGYRTDRLAKQIKAEYGVSQRKAKFLAKQETSLLVSKYAQVKMQGCGIEEYEWSTSGDIGVRPDHKLLDGTIQRWDSPPVVDRATGRRAHAGEDFGCRCVALPVIYGERAE